MFSSVYHCKGLKDRKDYAIKVIRANAMMRRAADKEVEMYKRLEKASGEDPEARAAKKKAFLRPLKGL